MTPTPKLRFVERSQPDYPGAPTGRTVRILQQWWAPEDVTGNEILFELRGEWRDVPLETKE